MEKKGFMDFKFEELKHFAQLIIESNSRQEAMRKLNGLKRGYKNTKVFTPTTAWRIGTLEEIIRTYKK
jgi:hypothetical protein